MTDTAAWFFNLNSRISELCSNRKDPSVLRDISPTSAINPCCTYKSGKVELFPVESVKAFSEKIENIYTFRRLDVEKSFSKTDLFIAMAIPAEQITYQIQQFISKTIFDIFCETMKCRQNIQIMGLNSKTAIQNKTGYSTSAYDKHNFEFLKFNTISLPRDIKRMVYSSVIHDYNKEDETLISIPRQALVCYHEMDPNSTLPYPPKMKEFHKDTLALFEIIGDEGIENLGKEHDSYIEKEYERKEKFSANLSIVELYIQALVQAYTEPIKGYCCPINNFIINEINENAEKLGINAQTINMVTLIIFQEAFNWIGYIRNHGADSLTKNTCAAEIFKYHHIQNNDSIALFDLFCDFEIIHRFIDPVQE